jgi:acetamidase/formamidase
MPDSHELSSSPDTVHWGYFDAALEPVLQIASGDRVTVDTVSGVPDAMPPEGFTVREELRRIHAECRRGAGPHIVTGPIFVDGAKPGDTLEIRILDIELADDWGWNIIRPLMGTLPEDFPFFNAMHLAIDRNARTARLPWGGELPLSPFFGIITVAPPPVYGAVTSVVPREYGGNIDNKELVAGTTLYLPVFNEGALLSVGDGHAVQGDGEVCLTALETGLTGTFEIVVRKDIRCAFPRAETPSHVISMGLNEDLDMAARQAVREMVGIICEQLPIRREEAYSLCSMAADFRVTQLVDGNKGIHGLLNKMFLDPERLTVGR